MNSTVLVVTALEDVTADRVVAALNERGVPVVRVDPADIGPSLTFGFGIAADRQAWSGRLCTASREVEPGEVAAVYYRRPTPYSARFAHLPRQQRDFAAAEARHGLGGVLNDLPGARYVNHPAAVARADLKPAQLRRFARLGLRIPPTLITNDVKTAKEFAAEHGPVVCKTWACPAVTTGAPERSGPSGSTRRSSPSAPDESGYGLLLVEELADRWGVRSGPAPCKVVWAELDPAR